MAQKVNGINEQGKDCRSAQTADLLLSDDPLDILGLALDAVAGPAVSLDWQAGDDGIDAALFDGGAALRPLQLVMHVIVDRKIVGHRYFPVEARLLGAMAGQSN
jgi:hypothetical protein